MQGAAEVGTKYFFVSVDFLINSEQYANTCMAVLIRRVTCKDFLGGWGWGGGLEVDKEKL